MYVKMLAVAKQQKLTIAASQKEELKESYERKYVLEQERLDIQMAEDLKKYEEKEKIRKDVELQKLQEVELRQQREKKQLQLQNEINELQLGYQKRLTNYQQILREKYE